MCEDAPYFKKISQSGVEQQEEMNTQRSKQKFNIKLIMKKKKLTYCWSLVGISKQNFGGGIRKRPT